MENGERRSIPTQEAISLLADEEYIHTFIGLPNVLIGADWKREDVVRAIYEHRCEVGGSMCRRLGHGLVILKGNDPLFVEVDNDKLKELDRGAEE